MDMISITTIPSGFNKDKKKDSISNYSHLTLQLIAASLKCPPTHNIFVSRS